jgi:hypothetical protein
MHSGGRAGGQAGGQGGRAGGGVRCKLREADQWVADWCAGEVRSGRQRRPCAEPVVLLCLRQVGVDRKHAGR